MMSTVLKSTEHNFYIWAMRDAGPGRESELAYKSAESIPKTTAGWNSSEGCELRCRLAVLLAYLLKWRYQSGLRPASWQYTIGVLRRTVRDVLSANPLLEPGLEQIQRKAYLAARLAAARETGLDEGAFPRICPFSIKQVVDPDFWPD